MTTLVFRSNEHHGLLDVPTNDCELRVVIRRDQELEGYTLDAEAVELSTGSSDAWYAYLEFVCDPLAFEAIGELVPDCAFFDEMQWVFSELPDAIHWAKRFAIDGMGVESKKHPGMTRDELESLCGNPGLDALRYHVSGAIERGEAVAIVEQPAKSTITSVRRDVIMGCCTMFGTIDGTERHLFSYYIDELAFSDTDLIGLTEDEAHKLRLSKDVAYLRS